ncbi:MAG TPA: DUF4157 domain-containing protein, partial [Kofleriaceae bacterium]|nr:DUF4157 domain-containing protein [Kofleriaceae bacterium]
MNHEHEQRRARSAASEIAADLDPIVPEPGQVSRSASLRRPDPAIAPGLASGARPGARFAARGRAGRSQEATRELLEQVFAIVSAAGAGAPLPGEVAARMKAALGPAAAPAIDQVRVHTDDAAAQATHLLGAQAFALGHHVYFDRGQYAPGTEAGDRLLRHELTHVVQYTRGELAAHG